MDFEALYKAVEGLIKIPGASRRDVSKNVVNMAYLEMMSADDTNPLYWLHAPIRRQFHAPKTITNATQANPCVITSASHGFVGGEIIAIWDVEGMVELNYDYTGADVASIKFYQVDDDGIAVNTFKLKDLNDDALDASGFTAYTSGGTINHHGWRIASVIHTISAVGLHENTELTSMTWEELIKDPDYWIDNDTSTPERFIHQQVFASDGGYADLLYTFPASQESDMAYPIVDVKTIILTSDTDVPLMPPEFHYGIVAGAAMRLMENNVQVENAVIWPGIYRNMIGDFLTYNRKLWQAHKQGKRPFGL